MSLDPAIEDTFSSEGGMFHGAAGGVHLAGQDIAQGVKPGLAGAGSQNDGLDGGVLSATA